MHEPLLGSAERRLSRTTAGAGAVAPLRSSRASRQRLSLGAPRAHCRSLIWCRAIGRRPPSATTGRSTARGFGTTSRTNRRRATARRATSRRARSTATRTACSDGAHRDARVFAVRARGVLLRDRLRVRGRASCTRFKRDKRGHDSVEVAACACQSVPAKSSEKTQIAFADTPPSRCSRSRPSSSRR